MKISSGGDYHLHVSCFLVALAACVGNDFQVLCLICYNREELTLYWIEAARCTFCGSLLNATGFARDARACNSQGSMLGLGDVGVRTVVGSMLTFIGLHH